MHGCTRSATGIPTPTTISLVGVRIGYWYEINTRDNRFDKGSNVPRVQRDRAPVKIEVVSVTARRLVMGTATSACKDVWVGEGLGPNMRTSTSAQEACEHT